MCLAAETKTGGAERCCSVDVDSKDLAIPEDLIKADFCIK